MSSIYPKWANSVFWAVTGITAATVVGIPITLMVLVRTDYVTGRKMEYEQPIQFDHRHHVLDDAIDCLYCHYMADRSPHAGVPPTELCMNCHGQIWHDAPMLEPLRQSFFDGLPIAWRRVHELPDFVFFNHQVHIHRGIGCVSCHGRVDRMPAVHAIATLDMDWCLDCHTAPERFLRPLDRITDMTWEPPLQEQLQIGARLKEEMDIQPPLHCTACHR